MTVRSLAIVSVLGAAGCASAPAIAPGHAIQPIAGEYVAPQPLLLAAQTIRTWPVPEADQGVAVGGAHFYAVDNSTIAKYDIAAGRLVARWSGPEHGLIRHLNSCFAYAGRLWCANSNYSLTPMGSSIEVFDARTLAHVDTHSLGLTDEGSLTWFDRYRGGWMAGFAHYTGGGGVAFKDHTFSSVVTFDAEWRRTGGWLFPAAVVERMAPDAASGGAIGPTLIHVATIDVEAEGQAFSWATGGRSIFAIDRRRRNVMQIVAPEVSLEGFADARRFER